MKAIGFVLIGFFNIVQVHAGELEFYQKFKCKGIGVNENVVTLNINFLNEDETNIQTNLGSYLFTKDFEQDETHNLPSTTHFKNTFISNNVTFEVELTKKIYRIDFIYGFINIIQANGDSEKVNLDCESSTHTSYTGTPHCPGGPRCGPPYDHYGYHMTAAGCLNY